MTEEAPVDVAIVGAGIVGLSTAWRCLDAGFSVTIVERGGPTDAASYGNAGVISRGSIFPVAGPGVPPKLMRYALNQDPGLRLHYSALPSLMPWLIAFLKRCDEASVREAAAALDPLCAAAYDEHWRLAGEIGARDLIERRGWLKLYRSEAAFAGAALEREILAAHRIAADVIDGPELKQFEPALKRAYAKALWFPETGAVRDPGDLVARLRGAVIERGGHVEMGDVVTLFERDDLAHVQIGRRTIPARQVVLAAGAAADDILKTMGYRYPLAAERGYHRHFVEEGDHKLSRPIHDTGGAYVVSPTNRGLRLLSGVEMAKRTARPTPVQIALIEADARGTVGLGAANEPAPWCGSRPSTPDGLPVIGRAPRHPKIVFAFGHGHIGLSTGPATGAAVAALLLGRKPDIPLQPFAPTRFG